MRHIPLLLILFPLMLRAQQDPLSTQFWNNYSHFNPGSMGLYYEHTASIMYRRQWESVNGAPESVHANYSTLVKKNHGLGINYIYDHVGFSENHTANVNYNYQIMFDSYNEHILSFGVGIGLMHFSSYGDWIPPTTNEDPLIETATSPIVKPNFNTGIAYKKDYLYLGLGVTHLFNFRKSDYSPAQHYYLMGDYTLRVNREFSFVPRLIVQTDAVKVNFDVSIMAILRKRYWLSAGYRYKDIITLSAGWNILRKFKIGYSYDFSVGKLANFSNGTHEFVIGVQFGSREVHRPIQGNPNF
ncbi:MAG: PorP/SprF family type IX secretion system membrane protein [Crocinitomicaceae bacterium]|nr:PorP/SprF family type IX secretion system membrane protein [Crocinitomicaceae bacterium]